MTLGEYEMRFRFDHTEIAHGTLTAIFGKPGHGSIAAIAGCSTPGRQHNKPVGKAVFFPNTSEGRRDLVAWSKRNQEKGLNSFLNSALWPASAAKDEAAALGQENYAPLKFWCLWADLDGESVNRDLLRRLTRKGCVVTRSGGVGRHRRHIRVLLDTAITDAGKFRRLNQWLAAALNADSKFNEYSWLTMPESTRFKPEYVDGRPVRVVQWEDEERWSVEELEALFAEHAPTPRTVVPADDRAIVPEDVPWESLPRPVRAAWKNGNPNKSDGEWNYMCLCAEYGVSQGAALHWAIEGRGAGNFPARHSNRSLKAQIAKAYADVEGKGKLDSRRKAKVSRKASPADGDLDADSFWTARPELRHIRDFALSRRRSPWGVLGVVLARVSTAIPPNYVLPPESGSYGSLNTYVGLVGQPGSGKSTSVAAGRDAVYVGEVHVANIGSGEGIAHRYAYRDKKANELKPLRDAALFHADEIGRLRALMNRAGSTLMSELLTAWSGGPLGFSNADSSRTINIAAHRYRMAFITGVQPDNADVLFGEAGSGLPQRFILMPVRDSSVTREAVGAARALNLDQYEWTERSEETVALVPDNLTVEFAPDEWKIVSLPPFVQDLMDEADLGERDDIDGHALFVRAKVAALLMWLNHRTDAITANDWELAGTVMQVSDATRAALHEHLAHTAARAGEAKAWAEGERAVIADEAREAKGVERMAESICRNLAKKDTRSMTESALQARLNSDAVPKYFKRAILDLIDQGKVERDMYVYHGRQCVKYTLID